MSTETITLALEPLPDDAPAIVTYAPPPTTSVSNLVTTLLAEFETAAVELFPSWLPGAEGITGPGGASIPAVRAIALRTASATRHFGPFLADLAEQALRGTARGTEKFPHEIRALGLARILAYSFRRDRAAILMRVPQGLSPVAEDILAAASEWLADRGGFGVWLTGAPLTSVDRIESMTIRLPAEAVALIRSVPEPPSDEHPTPRLTYPPVTGRPHPASQAEQRLEAALSICDWAAGRAWNQPYQSGLLSNRIRVDLVWWDERCIVEVDDDRHRERDTFAADRQRDVRLQQDGYAVLRFTDDQVLNDVTAVLTHLERYLQSRRSGTFEGSRHAW
ncbi:endonuclease domain-containing protein [Sphaerimonospora thailandensis]|uniref:endonuclease domain-containing protein n=1 Tax=Sphaerimonospora thailandensis TaxID=795644 RepID=UPI001951ECFD|nr:DUF559 domain-containing protein [Sphaerimonospora thailandensis]